LCGKNFRFHLIGTLSGTKSLFGSKVSRAQDIHFIQRRSDEFRFYLKVVFLLMFLGISVLAA